MTAEDILYEPIGKTDDRINTDATVTRIPPNPEPVREGEPPSAAEMISQQRALRAHLHCSLIRLRPASE